jgi:LysR family transcriptional regulator, benzoate and cis,cis-muconate-responsive activator of ben and cat genes
MELRQLRYFAAVAEELNFSRAALRLHIAQPPLSQQIRNLEEEMGLILLDRGSRPLRLTQAGKFFHARCGEILSSLHSAVADTKRIGSGHSGWLGIGFVSSVMNVLLPNVLQRFRAAFPDVEMQLFEMIRDEQAAALLDRRIHVGFVRPTLGESELVEELLYDESFIVAIPSSHRFALRDSVAIDELVDEPIVLYGGRTSDILNDNPLLSVWRDSGIEPKIAVEAQHADSALGLVAAGMGLALTGSSFGNFPRAGISFVPLTGVPPNLPMKIAYRPDERSPIVSAFLRIVREEAAAIEGQQPVLLAWG